MKPGAVAALVGTLALEELPSFVDALPDLHLRLLRVVCEERVLVECLAALQPLAPVVVPGPPPNADAVLTVEELARERGVSRDTVYRYAKTGLLRPLPRPRGGRIHFRRGEQPTDLAPGIDRRYSARHDTARGQNNSDANGVDATRARPSPRRDGNDRRALGARRAERVAPRSGEPWAPGSRAWSDPKSIFPRPPEPPKG